MPVIIETWLVSIASASILIFLLRWLTTAVTWVFIILFHVLVLSGENKYNLQSFIMIYCLIMLEVFITLCYNLTCSNITHKMFFLSCSQ